MGPRLGFKFVRYSREFVITVFSRGNFPDSVCIEGAEIESAESDSKKLLDDPDIWNAKILPVQVVISSTIFVHDNSKKLVHFYKIISLKTF